GTPPPPPLPNVPALKDNTVSATLSVRERLAEHRANATCASCHNLMDPVGFALENFDAIGRCRTVEEGQRIDTTGGLPDGSKFTGVSGLEDGLRNRPELFVGTLTEKLMTFALGRGIETYDAPAVRKIVHDAQAKDFRFSSVILGIVNSTLDETLPILRSLATVKEHVTAITNLELPNAYPGSHATSNSAFLSAAKAKLTESTDYYLGTTVDQIAAKQIGQETQLPSLEL